MKNIVCFGEILWDCLPTGAVEGGAPMNVAIRLKRLNHGVQLISKVGDDALGEKLKSYIANENISIAQIQTDEKLPTGTVEVELDDTGSASYTIVEPVAWDNIRYTKSIERMLPSVDIILYGTLAVRSKTSLQTLRQILQHGTMKVYDVNLRPPHGSQKTIEELMDYATLAKMNDDEVKEIVAWYTPFISYEAAIVFLAEKFDLQQICVTKGDKGAIYWDNGKFYIHAGYKATVKDTVGAGDSFLGTLLSQILAGASPEKALDMASAIGAIVTEHEGANPHITQEMIDAKINMTE